LQRLGCHFSFVLLALTSRGATSYPLGIYLRPLLFFSLFPYLPTPPPCRAFSPPLVPLVRLSFYLSHVHFTSHSNELKSSHNPLAHLPHFSCEIKAVPLSLNNNAIAPLSHCLCAPIATTLRTAYIQRNFKEITLGHRIKRQSPSTFIQNNKKEMFLRLHRAKSNERTAVKHRSKTVLK